jgi:beta-lactamase regulating signal transducer with metallopeptidase domain
MWTAVLWNLAAFMCLALLLVWMRYRLARAEEALEEAHANRAVEGPSGPLSIKTAPPNETALAGNSEKSGDSARSA